MPDEESGPIKDYTYGSSEKEVDPNTLPSCKNFCKGTINHHSISSKNSARSCLSINSWFGLLSITSIFAILSCNGIASIASVNSLLSIGSVNSFMSIGSVNSALAIGCSGKFMKRCVHHKAGSLVCDGIDNYTFNKDVHAGTTCEGGSLNDRDSNDGATTGVQCVEGGGDWVPYSCDNVEDWLLYSAEKEGLDKSTQYWLIENWWAPKCCTSTE